MAGKNVLVPYNFTAYDEKALHYVIHNFAGQKWVKVTLFHAYAPLPEIDGYTPSLGRLKSTMASMWKEHREREEDMKRVVDDLIENGFTPVQVEYVFKPRSKGIGAEIVQMAQRGAYNIVVLSREPGKITRAFMRNVHDEVLSNLTNTEICIIT